MSVADLINAFASREELPIDVQDDVVPEIARRTGKTIYFWAVAMDTGIISGQYNEFSYIDENGNEVSQSDVDYSKDKPVSETRLVCCKELIHTLDHPDARVMTDDEFDRLVALIGLPLELSDPMTDGITVNSDRVALFQALAILIPWACRSLLMGPYQEGKITLEEIAAQADLPLEYVAVVMHPGWERLHRAMTQASV